MPITPQVPSGFTRKALLHEPDTLIESICDYCGLSILASAPHQLNQDETEHRSRCGERPAARRSICLGPECEPTRMKASKEGAPTERILVVDDFAALAVQFSRVLDSFGYEARYAFDGETALGIAAEFRPDILISDFQMPGMNGLDLIRQVRRILPGCWGLLVSGHSEAGTLAHSSANVAFLQKPVSMPTLLIVVQEKSPSVSIDQLPPRVLLVEDHEAKCYSVSRWLTRNGFEVHAVRTAAAAREQDLHNFDCVILDVFLHDGNGFELCRQLRSTTVEIPIVHFSGSMEGNDAECESLSSGADEFIPSSIEPDLLVFKLRQHIQNYAARLVAHISG